MMTFDELRDRNQALKEKFAKLEEKNAAGDLWTDEDQAEFTQLKIDAEILDKQINAYIASTKVNDGHLTVDDLTHLNDDQVKALNRKLLFRLAAFVGFKLAIYAIIRAAVKRAK
jgi:hypothetical protein